MKEKLFARMSWQKQSWFFVFLLWSIPSITQANVSIAEWTFSGNTTDYTLADGGIFDNLTQKINSVGTTNPPTFSTSNGLVTVSGWNSNAPEKYWLIPFSSLGYRNVTLSFKTGGSNTGPRDFRMEYRVGESGVWQSLSQNPLTINSSSNSTNTLRDNIPQPKSSSYQKPCLI